MEDIAKAKKYIDSSLFRPPYGKITPFQLKLLAKEKFQLTPMMWTVLSGDFDVNLSKETCLENVLTTTNSGSIVVFHDSQKAIEKLQFVLPKILDYFKEKGFRFEKIVNENFD
jgi:peptidoglycan/xylan/chitin deacetylase (PgdA/CDA1 family)